MLTTRENKILKMIEDEVMARQAEIVTGALSHDDYKDLTGFVRGLMLVVDFINGIEQEQEDR